MIIKERIPFLLVAVGIIGSVYLFPYFATPGYIVPLWNNPIARIFMFGFLAIFVAHTVSLFFFPKPKTDSSRISVTLYFIVSIVPNMLIPLIGPAFVTVIHGY